MATREVIAGIVLVGLLIGGIYIAIQRAKKNRELIIADQSPKVAGEDELGGKALNPGQFDEPDDEILDTLGAMLDEDED